MPVDPTAPLFWDSLTLVRPRILHVEAKIRGQMCSFILAIASRAVPSRPLVHGHQLGKCACNAELPTRICACTSISDTVCTHSPVLDPHRPRRRPASSSARPNHNQTFTARHRGLGHPGGGARAYAESACLFVYWLVVLPPFFPLRKPCGPLLLGQADGCIAGKTVMHARRMRSRRLSVTEADALEPGARPGPSRPPPDRCRRTPSLWLERGPRLLGSGRRLICSSLSGWW